MASLVVRLFVFVPIFLLGATLSASGLVMVLLSLNRLLGLVAFGPYILLGGLMVWLSLAAAVALRRADRTVGSFFEQQTRDHG